MRILQCLRANLDKGMTRGCGKLLVEFIDVVVLGCSQLGKPIWARQFTQLLQYRQPRHQDPNHRRGRALLSSKMLQMKPACHAARSGNFEVVRHKVLFSHYRVLSAAARLNFVMVALGHCEVIVSQVTVSHFSSVTATIAVVPTTSTLWSSSTTSIASASRPTSTFAGNSKRGIPYNDPAFLNAFSSDATSWAYNWDSITDEIPSHLEFVPTLWSSSPDHTTQWSANVLEAMSYGSSNLLSFNEPDRCTPGISACTTPSEAAAAYLTYLQPFNNLANLGAPSISNADTGLPWLRQFLALCSNCSIDFVSVHWYDSASNFAYFVNYMEEVREVAAGRDIWITEFEGYGSVDDQIAFLEAAVEWLNGEDSFVRYAWAGAFVGSLVEANGDLTELGEVYNA